MNSNPAADLEAVKSDLTALRDDLASLSKSLVNRGTKSARDARSAIESGMSDAAERFEECVGTRPYTSVLLAFGAGVIATALMRGR